MEKEYSSKPMLPWEYYPQHDGTAVVVLRKNIERDVKDNDDGTSYEFWKADTPLFTVTDLPLTEIEANFDALWYQAEREQMTDAQWRADIESALLDLMEVIA